MTSTPNHRLDNDAVQAAYHVHVGALERFLAGVLKDSNLVSDVLQIAFTRLIEKGGSVNPESLRSWLFRVAYNEAMLVHRKQKVDQRAKDSVAWCLGSDGDLQQEGFSSLLRQERAELVRDALSRLPAKQKQVVQLRIHEGLKFAEIAERLQIPLGTVLTRMRSGLKKIKDQLEDKA